MTAPQPHPVAAMLPMMTDAELHRLAADISEHGLQEPIVLLDGQVLDGRNRLAACRLASVPPRFVEWDGEGSPTVWVLSKNLHRRHLTSSQQALVAAAAKAQFQEEAKARQLAGLRRGPVSANLRERAAEGAKAAQQAAEACGVSTRSVESAAKVLEHGVPELREAVQSGAVAVSAAAAVADEPEDVQRELLAEGPHAVKQAAAAKRGPRLSAEERARLLAMADPTHDAPIDRRDILVQHCRAAASLACDARVVRELLELALECLDAPESQVIQLRSRFDDRVVKIREENR